MQLRKLLARRQRAQLTDLQTLLEQATTKTEGGQSYPAEAYAHVGDPDKPSTWKLRLWESPEAKVTAAQLGRAAAACSTGGFRGQKVELSEAELTAAKAKIRAAYRKLGTKAADVPASVKEQLVDAGVLVEVTGSEGTGLCLPLDPTLEETYVTISGTWQATIADLRRAVKEHLSLFGGDEASPWGVSLEGNTASFVIVSGPDDTLYRAKWSRDEQGAVAFSNVEVVKVNLQTVGGATVATNGPASTPPATPVPVGDGAAFLATERAELLETFLSPVRVLAEKDAGEGAKRDHLMTVECVLGQAEVPTANGRVYTRGLFDRIVSESAAGTARSKRWLGEANHPEDGRPRLEATISKPWRELRLDEAGRLLGTTDIIDTTVGADVQKLVRNGVPVQVSSRTAAKTTQEVREGRSVEVVDEQSALDNWGGWDFVLGAAAPEAAVTSFSEKAGTPAAPAASQVDLPGQTTVEEMLETMDVNELIEKTTKSVTERISDIIKPLLETKAPAATETKPEVKAQTQETQTPDLTAQLEKAMGQIGELTKRLDERDKAEADAAKAKVTTEALGQAVTAVMERDEVKAWPEPARKLMASALSEVKDPELLAPTFERVMRNLSEVGLLVAGKPAGLGLAAAGMSKEQLSKERGKMFQLGILPRSERPESLKEMVALLSEGIPDNGKRSYDDPDDPVVQMLGSNLPFPGYHPDNARHQFEALAWNMVRFEDGKYARPHLKSALEWTGVAAVAQSVPFVLPMVRQVWMRLIARELCSVQPMNKSTGIVHYLKFLSDPGGADFSVPGEWNSEYAQYISEQTAMREVKLTLTHSDINMDTKKLKAEWSTEVRQNLRADHGLDIAAEMVNFMADEIAREVNALLLNDMRLGADPDGITTAGNTNFGCLLPATGYTNRSEWDRELYTAILQSDALIRATRRARSNWIVAGQNALIRLMRLDNWTMQTADPEAQDWNVGINLVGTVQGNPTFRVYAADADLFPTEMMLLGRRGTEWPDAGEVYCPWIPLFTTPVFIDPNTFCEREAVMSRFGYKKVVGNAYATVTCQPAVQGTAF